MSERLSELFPLRLTPSLKRALEREARSLGMRPVDIARLAIAQAVSQHIEQAVPDEPSHSSTPLTESTSL